MKISCDMNESSISLALTFSKPHASLFRSTFAKCKGNRSKIYLKPMCSVIIAGKRFAARYACW